MKQEEIDQESSLDPNYQVELEQILEAVDILCKEVKKMLENTKEINNTLKND